MTATIDASSGSAGAGEFEAGARCGTVQDAADRPPVADERGGGA